jgi:hypothetical protein
MMDARDRLCAHLRDIPSVGEAIAADTVSAARREGLHLVLATRLRLPSLADELREATVLEALRAHELRAVLDRLAQCGIRPVLLKGVALAQTHYPSPESRPRSDTDLMIPVDARASVEDALLKLGYERPTEIGGELAVGQFHFVRTDRHGVEHALDVHWRVSNVRVFADVLSYEELARDAVALPALGPHARGSSCVHGLLVACVHRVAHHGDSSNLLWLYDVHLLGRALTSNERNTFIELAGSRRVRAVCASTLQFAQAALGGLDEDWIARVSNTSASSEPSAAFLGGGLRQADILKADLAATAWPARFQLLREHVLPSASYMRRRYPDWPAALLPVAYFVRIVRGAPRWLRR